MSPVLEGQRTSLFNTPVKAIYNFSQAVRDPIGQFDDTIPANDY